MSGLGEWDDDAPVYDLGDAPVADVDDELVGWLREAYERN